MINLKASRKTPTINISANPVTNVHVTNRGDVPAAQTTVRYPNPSDNIQGEFVSVMPQAVTSSKYSEEAARYAATTFTPDMTELQSDNPEVAKLLRENAVLKLIIDIQHSNPLIVNKYIIPDDATLVKLVSLLCNASEVHIDAEDVECGCTAKNTYRKVHAIFVVVDGQTKNLKYDFSDVMYTLKELHISTKYVF